LNMTPMVRNNWVINVHGKKTWKEIFNTDDKKYYGTGDVFNPEVKVELLDKKDDKYRIHIHLPALGGIVLK
jgi:1,4-alpha-glucan branching enzyme